MSLKFTIIIALLVGNGGIATASPLLSGTDPFSEGVTYRPLSETERDDLRKYAEASKGLLSNALEQAKGKSFEEAMNIYRNALSQVVRVSYNDNRRSELLMRMALNQALELTVGLPSADAGTVQSAGLLADIANINLLTVILEDSIKLAVKYIPEDQQALENGSFASLPYLRFSLERLVLARLWGAAITENAWQYRYYKTVLRQWAAVATHEAQPRSSSIAKELMRVDDLLSATTPRSEEELKGSVRVFRGELRRLIIGLSSVLKLDASEVQQMGDEDFKFVPSPTAYAEPHRSETGSEAFVPNTGRVDLEVQAGSSVSTTGANASGLALNGRLEVFLHERPLSKVTDYNPSITIEGHRFNDAGSAPTSSALSARLNILGIAGYSHLYEPSHATYDSYAFLSPTVLTETNGLWGDYKGVGINLLDTKLRWTPPRSPGTNYAGALSLGTITAGTGTFHNSEGNTSKISKRVDIFDLRGNVSRCGKTGICIQNEAGLKLSRTGSSFSSSLDDGDAFQTLSFTNDAAIDLLSTEWARRLRMNAHYRYEYERNSDLGDARSSHRHLLMLGGTL